MESLVLEIRNSDTVHAIAEAAKRQGTTPEAARLNSSKQPSSHKGRLPRSSSLSLRALTKAE